MQDPLGRQIDGSMLVTINRPEPWCLQAIARLGPTPSEGEPDVAQTGNLSSSIRGGNRALRMLTEELTGTTLQAVMRCVLASSL
jgi:hypothetical protein